MLSRYVQTEEGRQRYLSSPVGPFLDGFAARLEEKGFAAATIYGDIKTIGVLGEFLMERGPASPGELDDAHVKQFLDWYFETPRKTGPARRGPDGSVSLRESLVGSLRKFVGYLRDIGATPAPTPSRASSAPFGDVTEDYLTYLVHHRGFAVNTVAIHRLWVERFFVKLAARKPPPALITLTTSDVEEVFLEISEGVGRRFQQILTSTVDALMRYLRTSGVVPDACRPFLPRHRSYALAALPTAIPWEVVGRALESFDRATSMGKRDYAIFLLLATYGLRSGEVAGLSLDDVDWKESRFRVHQPKTRRFLELPLVTPVAEALLDYLRDSRPPSKERRLFLKCHAPVGPITNAVVYWIVRKALLRAGADTPHYGPHALRHALATTLFRRGRSIKVVGDLLGHRLPEATLLYCKLAVEDLRGVALELPGGAS